jgi:3-oxoacyl-[acyl-carrier-protein] synthase-3
VFINLQSYGNTSAASIPIAFCEAIEAGRVMPGAKILFTAFGAGLTSAASVMRWGNRKHPLRQSGAELKVCEQSALQLIQAALEFQREYHARSSG